MVSWETVVEGASMPPLVLTPIQSGQGLPDCVYNARLVFARTFSKKGFLPSRAFIRYNVLGIDTEQVLGFAGTASGNVSSVWYFGAGYSAGEHPSKDDRARRVKFTDNGLISIEECAKPINFRKANDGRVTCFLRDP